MEFYISADGVLLNRYLLQDELGRGGFGFVYRALDLFDGQSVAVKVSWGDPHLVYRGVLEGRFLESIGGQDTSLSRHVVNMKTSYSLEGCVVLVLELLSHSLKRSIDNLEFDSFSKISSFARCAAEFLHSMSLLDIVHCDIKPENILVSHEGKIKFADFGLSYSPFLCAREQYIQTVYYRAPEVIMGYDYDGSVDTWSAGCVLLQCLLGRAPFSGQDDLELLQSIVRVIGMPAQLMMENSPYRDELFDYDLISRQWTVKGVNAFFAPVGLRRYVEDQLAWRHNSQEYFMFLDLVEGMMKFNPPERYTPIMCLNHPFLKCHNYPAFDSHYTSPNPISAAGFHAPFPFPESFFIA